ncbi:MAG: DUF1800 domain-containing protein [Acidobacteriota bacterium]|nr:DUF1800 domain-containing protein [Acidobacteriota bacterium]
MGFRDDGATGWRGGPMAAVAIAALSLGVSVGLAGCGSGVAASSTPAAVQVTISGAGQVRLGGSAQLTATVTNASNTAVTWQVNGTPGGSSALGTISAAGVYTPPASLPTPNTVTLTAVSMASPAVSASATETVLNPAPVVTSAAVSTNAGATSGLLDVIGSGFVPGAQIQTPTGTLPATFLSATELQATVTVTAGATTLAVTITNPTSGGVSATATAQVSSYKASVSAAARLLDQATFGPTLSDIQHVQAVGLQGYLNEQFAAVATVEPDIANPAPAVCMNSTVPCQQSEWWQAAVTAPDQLRQRVAFALSEIFVISTNSVNARSVTTYQNMLVKDAFANFSTLMKDVTLSPGMGAYLNMLNSAKPGIVNGVPQIANENYAREEMQLFSIGLSMLNQDGSVQLDSGGKPIPTYTEAQVQAFARAYTGWTYATSTGGSPTTFPNNTANYDSPMAAVESQHDTAAKVLLNGTTLPAGQSSTQDLQGALANLFNHPNVGPFICKQLIQHLVASEPSAAYVSRVAAVFANDGNGVRGNMRAVIQAILMDQDARASDTSPSFDGGHLREPMLYVANLIRGLGFANKDAVAGNDVAANASYASLSNSSGPLGERPYASGSVFNFFSPSYVIPGTTTNAPEFGEENTATAVLRLSLANTAVANGIGGFTVDLSQASALGITASKTGNAATDSANLVDALGTIFMHGQMPAQMRTAIINHVSTLSNIPQRVRVAAYLVISSSFYKIEH